MLVTPFEFKVHNWRKFGHISVTLPATPLCIVDQNGSGKTSIIAALYSLCSGKAWPGLMYKQLLKNGENYFGVSAATDWYLNGTMSSSGRLNTKYTNQTDMRVPVMTYLPTDNQWFFGSRTNKLSTLDTLLSQSFGNKYEISLNLLNKTLKQKSALLKHYLETGRDDHILASEYTHMIYSASSVLWKLRDIYLQHINDTMSEYFSWIESTDEFVLKLLRSTSHNRNYCQIGEVIHEPENSILWEKEKFAQRLLFGAQRDDFDYFYGYNGINAVLSRGEMRLFVLFLKYTAMKLHPQSTSIVWLLDDIFNEFDQKRELILFESLLNQSSSFIATSTKAPSPAIQTVSVSELILEIGQ